RRRVTDAFTIFAVASRINDLTLGSVSTAPDQRFIRSVLATKILNAGETLWVVAAGQASDTAEQRVGPDLSKKLFEYPMNLGDLANVVVVTACDDCLGPQASLYSWANYSTTGMVTVAAPGGSGSEGIPAPASQQRYARAMGTSQATAFVAGIA